jgi:hypothetical protein
VHTWCLITYIYAVIDWLILNENRNPSNSVVSESNLIAGAHVVNNGRQDRKESQNQLPRSITNNDKHDNQNQPHKENSKHQPSNDREYPQSTNRQSNQNQSCNAEKDNKPQPINDRKTSTDKTDNRQEAQNRKNNTHDRPLSKQREKET